MVALSSEDSPTSNLKQLIEDSLNAKIASRRKIKDKENLNGALVATLEEFMRCFTLVGFDLSDEPIIISRATTVLDGEALSSLTKKVLHDIVQKTAG